MNLSMKIFDLSNNDEIIEKIREMTTFHEAFIKKIKTSNIFIKKESRKEYNQKPYEDIKVINLKQKDFNLKCLKEIIENNKFPVLINIKSGKISFYESTDYIEHFYIGEQAKNQNNPYIRFVYGQK